VLGLAQLVPLKQYCIFWYGSQCSVIAGAAACAAAGRSARSLSKGLKASQLLLIIHSKQCCGADGVVAMA
jgi:hypothetical protein